MTNSMLLQKFIQSKFSVRKSDTLDSSSNLIKSGIIDSLGILQLVKYLEEQFEIKIEDEDLTFENFDTIDAITGFIDSKKS